MYQLTVESKSGNYILDFDGTPTVQQVLERHGITMPHPCGGRGVCGKCTIQIKGNISEPDPHERRAMVRLSCRTRLLGDAEVTLNTNNHLTIENSTDSILATSINTAAQIGAAVDIGTTTVVLSIYDLSTGECLASKSVLNPQSTVAADVMGRISYALEGHVDELQKKISDCIHTLAIETGYADKIDNWIITGNTTMLYLLTGKDPKALSASPFEADCLFGEEWRFANKPAYLPKCFHAFVGADITCALLESGMCEYNETALLCDIGTNGEIVLWKGSKLYTASTAAGPAFEGAGISCGCQSIPGAIEKVSFLNGQLNVKTIGNKPPVGLCGSGIIDAAACLLDSKVLDETGAMVEDEVEISSGLWLTQGDIRELQLAKAAIAAGIKTLLEITETKEEEIDTFYIAGGFGSHLNIQSAVRIGLIPSAFQRKTKILGNAALKGAARMLGDATLKNKESQMVSNAESIPLGGNSIFNENYIKEMPFPENTK